MLLTTERLIIRHFVTQDAPFILQLLNTPAWLECIGDKGVRTLADAHRYLINGPLTSYRLHGFGLSQVLLKDTGCPIGMCGLSQRDILDKPDLGYALLPEYAGQGYAYEACVAMLSFASAQWSINGVQAVTAGHNTPSIRLLERLGMVFVKTMPWLDGSPVLLFSHTQQSGPQ